MANNMASYKLPCNLRLTEDYEGMTDNDEDFNLDKGDVVLATSFDPINNCYLCKRDDWVFTLEDRLLEPAPYKAVYVLTVDVKHGDLYDMQEDGTTVLGVYDDRNLAENRLVSEYDTDKADLLRGSCSEDGHYEITEDYPIEQRKLDGVYLGAFAQIVVSEKEDGSFDRQYTYEIFTQELNK